MSQRLRAMAAGMSAQEANMVCSGSTLTGQTATGSTSQTDSFPIGPNTNVMFSTVNSNTGARLPNASASGPVFVFNGGSNALLLYPASGETINASSANSSFSVSTSKGAWCEPLSTGWAVILSA